MSECGTRVGKGLVTYPCDLDPGHEGPCRAQENAPSVRQRRTWEADQAQAILAPIAEINLAETPAMTTPAMTTGAVILRDVPHRSPSDSLSEARQALLEAVAEVEALLGQRGVLSDLLAEVEAAIPETAVGARSAASMLRAMLRA